MSERAEAVDTWVLSTQAAHGDALGALSADAGQTSASLAMVDASLRALELHALDLQRLFRAELERVTDITATIDEAQKTTANDTGKYLSALPSQWHLGKASHAQKVAERQKKSEDLVTQRRLAASEMTTTQSEAFGGSKQIRVKKGAPGAATQHRSPSPKRGRPPKSASSRSPKP